MRLYDTFTRSKRDLPPPPGPIRMYFCGPTVYTRIHVGNAVPEVLARWLKRWLELRGYDAKLVINITDINDKIYDAAPGASAQLASDATRWYLEDIERLGVGMPDVQPTAADTVPDQIDLIEQLLERDAAYVADGDVYFRVSRFADYGRLSGQKPDQVAEQEPNARKEDPRDFALWKANKPDEDTAWDSPWGRGRPGWHIECSAMAETLLGLDFEVHGGGTDLIFPHHENEAAQTRAARGQPLARIWMHNGMIQTEGEKMAKSVGNIFLLHTALDEYGPDAVVMYLLSGHYRQPLQFSGERLQEAAARAERIREAGRRLVDGPSPQDMAPLRERFFDALADDFNTAEALAAVFEWVREANRREGVGGDDLRAMLAVLGLEPLLDEAIPTAPADVVRMAQERQDARKAKDFGEADRLRDAIAERGWEVRDAPDGFELLPRPGL